MKIVTYNVHRCRGMDGLTSPLRIAKVLKRLKPDIIALQEVVGGGPRRMGQEEEIGSFLGMTPVLAPTRTLRGRLFGNVVLARMSAVSHATCDLSQAGREPRLCQRVDYTVDGRLIHIFNVHLGTSTKERRKQAPILASFIDNPEARGPKIVLGDFNEWRKGVVTEVLSRKFTSMDLAPFTMWRRTYPGLLPFLHLDHIYHSEDIEIISVKVARRLPVMMASDHMPITMELRFLE
jgi:endonuclease/exonuclease/phosphatase family metal-dependent hydrolase